MFKAAAESFSLELERRIKMLSKVMTFGVNYLNDCLGGIFPSDLVVVGAPSGAGKTQFGVATAIRNVENGKRVHFIALEAEPLEIERRLKYQYVANFYFSDPNREKLDAPLNFLNWFTRKCGPRIDAYDKLATDFCEATFKNLFTFYKQDKFNADDLISNVLKIEKHTDLIIVDHVHYFDWDDENDNRAVKKIAKTARDLCLGSGKPMILVSHLRKKDRGQKELVAGLDEFHGSSELYKIATKVITIAAGGPDGNGRYKTYFRTPKHRIDGGSTRYIAETIFDARRGVYEDGYKIGWSNAEKFGEIDHAQLPDWARRGGNGVQCLPVHGGSKTVSLNGRPKNYAPVFNPSERN